QQQMVAELAQTGTPVIVVATRNPYDAALLPQADAVLNIYGWYEPNIHGGVVAISGDITPTGKLPVDVPSADGSQVQFSLGVGVHSPVTHSELELLANHSSGEEE